MSYEKDFGDFSLPASSQEQEYVNYRPSDMSVLDMDDMDGALGRFTFRVLIKGRVGSKSSSKIEVTITSVGIHVRDSYDFEGEQPLGSWNLDADSSGYFGFLRSTSVSNSDFRKWRDTNNLGGDFMVYSDIKETKLSVPDVFSIP